MALTAVGHKTGRRSFRGLAIEVGHDDRRARSPRRPDVGDPRPPTPAPPAPVTIATCLPPSSLSLYLLMRPLASGRHTNRNDLLAQIR